VHVDPVARLAGDVAGERAEAQIADLDGAAAAAADDVVVMGRTAGHVGVLAGRQVDPLECPDLLEAENAPSRASINSASARRGLVSR
jgi:hypothetical protein